MPLTLLTGNPDNPEIILEDYGRVETESEYLPWNADKEFTQLFYQIGRRTLIDPQRRYELWTLVAQSTKLSQGAIIEIGVYKGGSAVTIAKMAQLCGLKDNIYLCDTFAGVVKSGSHDQHYNNGEHDDVSYDDIHQMIYQEFGFNDNVKILQGIFPDDTSHLITDKYFRFVHVDVDVYESAKDIYDFLWDRLVVGGIMVYDDYGFKNCTGITKFVNEQISDRDKHIIYNLNGHAVVIKIA